MKILTLSCYYPPEIAASLYLTEDTLAAFAEDGNEIKLFVPTPTRGVSDEVRNKYKKIKYETKYGGKLQIHRFALYREGKNTLLRALRYVFLEFGFFFRGLFTKADVIYVQSTPPIQGLMAAALKKLKKTAFVYNLQDIFPDSLVNTGLARRDTIIWKIGRVVENITYHAADKIIVISEDFKKNIMEKGVPEEKIVVVTNWVDTQLVKSITKDDNGLFSEYGIDKSKFYVCYSGNVGHTQNMDLLVSVAEQLKDRNDIGFIIVGDGAYKPQLETLIKEKQLDNVTLLPFQDYDRIAEVFSLGDVGLIISKRGVGTNSVPSKTWSIMAAQRPVLASFDEESELCRIIEDNSCGLCVPPDDETALKTAIESLADDLGRNMSFGKNGRNYVVQNITKEICTAKYVETVKNCTKQEVYR